MQKLIPVEVIIDTLLAMANSDIAKLKNCLKQLWSFIYSLDLTDEEKKKLWELVCLILGYLLVNSRLPNIFKLISFKIL